MCVCVSGRRFLNRLLGLPVARQNLLFNYFASTLAAEVSAAKAEGRFFEGFSDLGGSLYGGEKPKPQVVPLYRVTLKNFRGQSCFCCSSAMARSLSRRCCTLFVAMFSQASSPSHMCKFQSTESIGSRPDCVASPARAHLAVVAYYVS